MIDEIYIFNEKSDLIFSYSGRRITKPEMVDRLKNLIGTLRDFLGRSFKDAPQIITLFEKKICINPLKIASNEYFYQVFLYDKLDSLNVIKKIGDKIAQLHPYTKEDIDKEIEHIIASHITKRSLSKIASGAILFVILSLIYLIDIHLYFTGGNIIGLLYFIITIVGILLIGLIIGNKKLSSIIPGLIALIMMPIYLYDFIFLARIDAYMSLILYLVWLSISYIFGWIGGSIIDSRRLYDSEGARLYLNLLRRFRIAEED